MNLRPLNLLRRRLLMGVLVLATAGGIVAVTPTVASAHGSPTAPGSRTYLCYQDMILSGNANTPRNSQCAAAVSAGTTQPLYDWFGVLRSDGAGRTSGFIPDGGLWGAAPPSTRPTTSPATTGRPPG